MKTRYTYEQRIRYIELFYKINVKMLGDSYHPDERYSEYEKDHNVKIFTAAQAERHERLATLIDKMARSIGLNKWHYIIKFSVENGSKLWTELDYERLLFKK